MCGNVLLCRLFLFAASNKHNTTIYLQLRLTEQCHMSRGFNHCDSICSVAGGGNDDALEGSSLLSANAMASEHIFAPRDCDAVLYLLMQESFSRRRGWQAFSAFFGSLAYVSVPS